MYRTALLRTGRQIAHRSVRRPPCPVCSIRSGVALPRSRAPCLVPTGPLGDDAQVGLPTSSPSGRRPRGEPSGTSALVRTEHGKQAAGMRSQRLFVLVGAATAAAVMYARYVRPWQLTWGATSGEASRSLPGDELVPRPTFNATRAIT